MNKICLLSLFIFLYSQDSSFLKDKESDYKKGERFYSHKKYSSALLFLKKALDDNSTNGQAHFYLGNIYFAQKQYDKAEESYQKALELLPQDPFVLLNYASLKYNQKQFDVCEFYYQKIQKEHPGFEQSYEKLAMIYFRQFLFAKSAFQFEQLLNNFPNRRDKKNIEKWIIKLRENEEEALSIRAKLIDSDTEVDALKFGGVFSVNLKNILKEIEIDSKNAETIKEFDVDLNIID